uniref:Proteasome alpha-type subunits domain-containing protein n=1 Tax=Electrophorus electricus TaxID=8005 RepID=A0AAY5F281_ELEEL
MSYDRAITVFSPDAHLFQVDYAQEAVQKSSAVGARERFHGVCGSVVHIHVENRTEQEYARVLINRARVECQSHRLTVDDPITVEYITCYVSSLKQHYTQSNGRRPFGISTLIVGFDDDGTPNLYQTDPSGTYHAWKVGRSAKAVRELLEKSYREEDMESDALVLKLAVRALLEVGAKNIELATRERWSHEGAFAASTSLHAHPTFASAIRFWNQRR